MSDVRTGTQPPMTAGWEILSPDRIERHVMPVDDYRPHVMTMRCWCHPIDDGDDVIVHNALDGRELVESGKVRIQ